MNRLCFAVWNASLDKKTRGFTTSLAMAVVLLACPLATSAQPAMPSSGLVQANGASDGSDGVVVTGSTGVAIGAKASATGDSGVAIGGRAVDANGNPLVTDAATALGGAATANGARSLAAGFHASASADEGLALGSDAQTVATNGIAIGSGAQAGIPFSGVDATNAIALGFHSAASGAQSVALGAAAIASGEHSVALGTDSFADRDASVSVGNDIFGLKRQITNVADGTDDADAATVGQVRQVFATGAQQAGEFASFLGGGAIVGANSTTTVVRFPTSSSKSTSV